MLNVKLRSALSSRNYLASLMLTDKSTAQDRIFDSLMLSARLVKGAYFSCGRIGHRQDNYRTSLDEQGRIQKSANRQKEDTWALNLHLL